MNEQQRGGRFADFDVGNAVGGVQSHDLGLRCGVGRRGHATSGMAGIRLWIRLLIITGKVADLKRLRGFLEIYTSFIEVIGVYNHLTI